MGALIGAVIGLIIVGIVALVRDSKAKKHAAGMKDVLKRGGAEGRGALDKRLPARSRLFSDQDVEAVSERLAALAALGDLDAVAAESAALAGSQLHTATARAVARVALAIGGRDPAAQRDAHAADVAALEAAGTNRLSLRAIGSWQPLLDGLAGGASPTQAQRDEVVRFHANPVLHVLMRDAMAKLGPPSAG